MENVVLIVHLLLALSLIGVVLMQRSEGGGLGMGGGGGVMTGRAAATALGKVTWALAIAFIVTSVALTIIAAERSAGSSVVDRLGLGAADVEDDGLGPDLLPPGPADGDSLLPEATPSPDAEVPGADASDPTPLLPEAPEPELDPIAGPEAETGGPAETADPLAPEATAPEAVEPGTPEAGTPEPEVPELEGEPNPLSPEATTPPATGN